MIGKSSILLLVFVLVAGTTIIYYLNHQQTSQSGRNFGVKIILTHPDETTTSIDVSQLQPSEMKVLVGSKEVIKITYQLEAKAEVVNGELPFYPVKIDLSGFKVDFIPMKDNSIVNSYQQTLTPTNIYPTLQIDNQWHVIFEKSVDVSKFKPLSGSKEVWDLYLNHLYPIRYSTDNGSSWKEFRFNDMVHIQIEVQSSVIYVTLINEMKTS